MEPSQIGRWLSETVCEGQFDAQTHGLRESIEQRRQRLDSQMADCESFKVPERLVEAVHPIEIMESVEELVASQMTDKGQQSTLQLSGERHHRWFAFESERVPVGLLGGLQAPLA